MTPPAAPSADWHLRGPPHGRSLDLDRDDRTRTLETIPEEESHRTQHPAPPVPISVDTVVPFSVDIRKRFHCRKYYRFH